MANDFAMILKVRDRFVDRQGSHEMYAVTLGIGLICESDLIWESALIPESEVICWFISRLPLSATLGLH